MQKKTEQFKKQILDIYWHSAMKAQPEIDKYGFQAIMPEWEDFEEYMKDRLKHKKDY